MPQLYKHKANNEHPLTPSKYVCTLVVDMSDVPSTHI